MKNLVFEVETLVINIFQTGFLSLNENVLTEIREMAEKCKRYNLEILSNQLLNLLDSENQTKSLLLINKSVEILKKKISYDELGGY